MTRSETTPSTKRRSRRLVVFAKLAFGVILMAILITRVDLATLWERLISVDLMYLALMFVIPHVMIGINTYKWQIFLRELGISKGMGRLYGLYLVATFFNNFLPTMVGGDAVRVYVLGRDTKDASSVMAATFMERLTGFAGLVTLVPLILMSPVVTERYPSLWLLAPACIIGFLILCVMILSPRFDPVWRRLRSIVRLEALFAFLARTRKAVYRSAQSINILIRTYLLSLLFYIGAAAAVWAAAMSLGAEVSMVYLIMTVPLVLVAGMLPISLNGLGITEAGFALILQLSGVPLVDAIGVGILLRARLFITALVGGLLFMVYRSEETDVATEQ